MTQTIKRVLDYIILNDRRTFKFKTLVLVFKDRRSFKRC